MRLTAEEKEAHNAKSIALYKALIEKGSIGSELGIIVTMPPHMDQTQLTLPCLPERKKRKQTSAMQKRTGASTISLAKEVTRYDHLLDNNYQDNTDYASFDDTERSADEGEMMKAAEAVKVETPKRSKGILDL